MIGDVDCHETASTKRTTIPKIATHIPAMMSVRLRSSRWVRNAPSARIRKPISEMTETI